MSSSPEILARRGVTLSHPQPSPLITSLSRIVDQAWLWRPEIESDRTWYSSLLGGPSFFPSVVSLPCFGRQPSLTLVSITSSAHIVPSPALHLLHRTSIQKHEVYQATLSHLAYAWNHRACHATPILDIHPRGTPVASSRFSWYRGTII